MRLERTNNTTSPRHLSHSSNVAYGDITARSRRAVRETMNEVLLEHRYRNADGGESGRLVRL